MRVEHLVEGCARTPVMATKCINILATDYSDSTDDQAGTTGALTIHRPNLGAVLRLQCDGPGMNVYGVSSDNQAGAQRQISAWVDSAFFGDLTCTLSAVVPSLYVPLAAGTHIVEVWAGQQSNPSGTILGNWCYKVEGVNISVLANPTPARRFICLSDSIGGGGNSTSPGRTGFFGLIRADYPGRCSNKGYGFAALGDDTAANWSTALQTLRFGATALDILIQQVTNDFGRGVQTAANFGIELAALLDSLHAAFPFARLFVQEALPRADQLVPNSRGEILSQFITQQNTVVAARAAFCTLVPAANWNLSATNGPDYAADGLHLTDSGHAKGHVALKAAIGY